MAYDFNTSNWREDYNNLSEEEQLQVKNALKSLMRKIGLFSVGFIVVMYLFFRKPARQYAIGTNYELVPMKHPAMMGPQGYPAPRDQYGNVAPGMYATQHSNPFHMNAPNNQYSPYNEFFTQNPNQHPRGHP